MTDLTAMQADLRRAYLGGGVGAIVSGLVWLVAALVAQQAGLRTGYLALFIGGMLIYPVSTLFERHVLRVPAEAKGNPGGPLVMETLPAMLGGLLFAFLLIDLRPDWVFAVAAFVVGAHYFPFRTAYGDRTYWVLGGVVAALGAGTIWAGLPPAGMLPWLVAAVEIMGGVFLIAKTRREFA